MSGGTELKILDRIEMKLRSDNGEMMSVYIDVYDSSLSRKWLSSLNTLLRDGYHLEKNYCFFGFPDGPRSQEYLLNKINESIKYINESGIGYVITDEPFTIENTTVPSTNGGLDRKLNHTKLNMLHRYFEDLQGVSGKMSRYYDAADPTLRWHIRQLNLLCHEYESLVLSIRKKLTAPMWIRPSQLMCWLNAPRFVLDERDYELFGIETIARPLGGVFVGVNKAVGKHHWEVFNDEGKDSRVSELITSTLKSQTEAAGDFDIEWANNPGQFEWMKKQLVEFREWLVANNFDPDDKSLTIGHPQVGQVDILASFGTIDYQTIWDKLTNYLDVYAIVTSDQTAIFDYRWGDADFIDRQLEVLHGKQK